VLWVFERYCRGRFARYFTTTRWATLTDPARWDRSVPTLFVANHTNWWDGFFAFLLGREIRITARLLMDAVQLGRYRAFSLVGALPIRRGVPRRAYHDLLAARGALGPGGGLWIFPQGRRRPQAERPARCEAGAAHLALAHGAPIRICPVALRYVFLGEQLPEAFALLGRPWVLEPGRYLDRQALMPVIERDLLAALDTLDALLRSESLASFRVLVQGRLSVNKRLDRVRHAVGLLRGPFEARNG
jgi:chlorobactene lauroyltransferase